MKIIPLLWFMLYITNGNVRLSEAKSCFYKTGPNYGIFCPRYNRLHTGKFTKDGRVGLLCHDVRNNTIEVLTFGEPNIYWNQKLYFCNDKHAKILVGDFNGDGRADLMCTRPGKKLQIYYANNEGRFVGKIRHIRHQFCDEHLAKLLVGDLNGDKKDDIICHHKNGEISYAHGHADGYFPNVFHVHMNWCKGKTSVLLLGDFNGDGVSDMLCHDTKDGSKSLSINQNTTLLKSGTWSRKMDWCLNSNDPFITVSDVNGDGLDDLICKDESRFGHTSVARNAKDVYFTDDDTYKFHFCLNGGRKNFYAGDFNGDGKSDLLCQTALGTREIDISHCT